MARLAPSCVLLLVAVVLLLMELSPASGKAIIQFGDPCVPTGKTDIDGHGCQDLKRTRGCCDSKAQCFQQDAGGFKCCPPGTKNPFAC